MQNILPISANRDSSGRLYLHDYSIRELADKFQTPCYVYDADTVIENAKQMHQSFSKYYSGEYEVTYAAKAYFSLGFARVINRLGLGVDVVSLGELKIAHLAGFLPERVHLHGNNKSEQELRYAVEWGVSDIVVDSVAEMEYLVGLALEYQKKVSVWIRVTPAIETNTHKHIQTGHKSSKFGVPVEDGQIQQAIQLAMDSEWLELEGLHAHLGSQLFDSIVYRQAFDVFANICSATGFFPKAISAGGGWGVAYTSDENNHECDEWIKTVSQATYDFAEKLHIDLPKLVIEPGRWLVARAGLAVYKVGFCKFSAAGHYFVTVDGGLSDNPRPALYDAKYEAVLGEREAVGSLHNASIVGKFCESGDLLIRDTRLPEMFPGELMVIPVAGAYQLSMSSNYNLAPRPAVIWVEKGKISILQTRENPEESGWWVSEVSI
jgi:diaminopimelate decarboxylase